MARFFYESWINLAGTLMLGVLAYVSLVILLRISGNRTLTKMNAFDWVVTVALGSSLATTILSPSTTYAQGVTAFAVLVGLQFVVTWTSVRMPWFKRLVTGEPVLLAYDGELMHQGMKRARITQDDLRSALRSSGKADVSDVHAVIMETDGTLSVVQKNDRVEMPALKGVRRIDGEEA